MYRKVQFFYFFFICIKTSFGTSCHYYNETVCPGIENCNEVLYCSEGTSGCYVLWSNSTDGNLTVKLKGCFLTNGDCLEQKCIERDIKRNRDLLFCCCKGDFCNEEFYWQPTPAPIPIKEESLPEHDDTVTYLAYVLFPLSFVILMVIMYLLNKKKISYFSQMPSMDQHSQSPPTPTPEKLRSITMIEIIARGKFGAVWKSYEMKDMVAVKIMPTEEKQSWLTEQEIYKLPLMDHENILRFIAAEKRVVNLRTEFWLITAYHELGSLQDFLKANTVTWEQLSHIAYTMAKGLAHLHEEIPSDKPECYKPAVAHRDFKSSNVLLKSDLTACIADFGLAIIFKPSRSCGDTHGQVGTRRYMAPEILEGAINFSRDSFLRIDMYACGLVLWELASRCSQQHDVPEYKLPFEEEAGSHPSLEDIQEVVVHKKLRPVIKNSWRQCPEFAVLCDTIEDCWDHDAEARLSASCVVERISWHTKSAVSPSTSLLYNEVSSTNNNNNSNNNNNNITITNTFSST